MTKKELKQKAIDFEKNWFDKDIAISDLLIEFATEATKELQEELDYAKSNCLFSDCDRVVRLKSQITELEVQIEKMKSPLNCKHSKENGFCMKGNGYCICDKWELED